VYSQHERKSRAVIILPKAKLVIVENPKCGSSTLKKTFKGLFYEPKLPDSGKTLPKHARIIRWKELSQHRQYNGYVSVGICRNPMAWVRSWYKFWNNPKLAHNTINLNFTQFTENYLEQKYKSTNFKTQSFYLDYRGAIGVDYLFPLENLGNVLEIAKSRWEGEMPYVKQSIANRSSERHVEALGEKLESDLKQHLSRDWTIYNKSLSRSRFEQQNIEFE